MKFFARIWPGSQIISALRAENAELSRQLTIWREAHMQVTFELDQHRDAAAKRDEQIKKMTKIIAMKGGFVVLMLLVTLSAFGQPGQRNLFTTNPPPLLSAIAGPMVSTNGAGVPVLSYNGGALSNITGVAVAQGTNIITTTNAGVVTVNGTTDTNMVNLLNAGLTNGAINNLSNLVALLGSAITNGGINNLSNYVNALGSAITNGGINNLSNYVNALGAAITNGGINNLSNYVNALGAAITNGGITQLSNYVNQVSLNVTNQGTVVSNGVVAHTVTVAGTANQITSSVGTAQQLANNPSTTLSLPSPTIFPGQISVVGITNASGNSNSVAVYDAKTNLTYLATGTGALTNNGSGVMGFYNGYASGSDMTNGAITQISNTVTKLLFKPIIFSFDGGGLVIATNKSAWVRMCCAGTLLSATLLTDTSASVGVDIWKTNYSAYPPLVANTIVASAPPAMAAAVKYQDATLTGWQKSFVSNDVFKCILYSNSAATQITINLDYVAQ